MNTLTATIDSRHFMQQKTTRFSEELVQELKRLCSDVQTGTLFIHKYAAAFVIQDSEIVGVAYGNTYGVRAIQSIKKIEDGTFFFLKDNTALLKKIMNSPERVTLPPTVEIFQLLGFLVDKPLAEKIHHSENKAAAKKILVVEDSSTTRKIIVHVLAKEGFNVIEADSGIKAMGQMHRHSPDLVLLDVIMPGMDGYSVLSSIRRNEKFKHVPVIMLTSRDGLLDKIKGKLSDINEYLTKPFEPAQLLEKITKHLPN